MYCKKKNMQNKVPFVFADKDWSEITEWSDMDGSEQCTGELEEAFIWLDTECNDALDWETSCV